VSVIYFSFSVKGNSCTCPWSRAFYKNRPSRVYCPSGRWKHKNNLLVFRDKQFTLYRKQKGNRLWLCDKEETNYLTKKERAAEISQEKWTSAQRWAPGVVGANGEM